MLACTGVIRAREGTARVGYGSKKASLKKYFGSTPSINKCFCTGFIDFILKGNNLTDFTNLFSPNDFKKMMI